MAEEVLTVARMSAKDETAAAFNSVQRNINNTSKAAGQLKQQFRFLRGGAGQVGHQIQDIAVQLQMGTDKLIVFGQQGSQIASLFGPQGALIGAVLAVGAAIGVSFTRDVKKGEDAIKNLTDHIKSQIELTGQLKSEYIDLLTVNFMGQIEEQAKIRNQANKTLEEQRHLLTASRNAQKLLTNAKTVDLTADQKATVQVRDFAAEQKEANRLIVENTALVSASQEKIEDLRRKLERLARGQNPFEDINQSISDTEKSANSFISSLEKQTASLTGGAFAAKAYELAQLNLRGELLDSAVAALDLYEQTLLQVDADKAAANAAKDREKAERSRFEAAQEAIMQQDAQRVREEEAERKRRQSQIDRLRTFEEFRNELGDTFMQMKKLEDGLVGVTERGMANFTNSFYDAISGAKSFKDAFHDMARSIVADLSKMLIQYYITQRIFGAITGAIGGLSSQNGVFQAYNQAVPLPSGDGGGFTGYGSRSGGLDGKGGFAAILHPNETVIDHTMGGQAGVTIVQNINVTTGVQQTVRAEIANLLPQISNAAKSAVADSRMRGGSFSRAMVGM